MQEMQYHYQVKVTYHSSLLVEEQQLLSDKQLVLLIHSQLLMVVLVIKTLQLSQFQILDQELVLL
jgi:hypothetical protein